MPHHHNRRLLPVVQGAAIAVVLGTASPESPAGNDHKQASQIPFSESTIIIEFNSSDEDVGVQFFIDADGWREVEIFNPRGKQIFEAEAEGRLLKQGGGTEMFLESEEPTLDELPLEDFFRLFPEGVYRFSGRTVDGERLVGSDEFTHDIPAGPDIVTPEVPEEGCAQDVPLPVVIAWNAVDTTIDGEPIEVAEYEVIVGDVFDVFLSGTQVTVPMELLEAGTEYSFEILAIEEGGNQTITESCLVTAE